MSGVWVFGYGSLVSPASFGLTLGRDLEMGVDVFEAEVDGYGRRWNYGTKFTFDAPLAEGDEPSTWTFVALGVTASAGESTNGIVAWVDDVELVALDLREGNYDRVDVTERVIFPATSRPELAGGDRVVTYVPRSEPIEIYEAARARGEAAITARYWHLVDEAFAALGPAQHRRYHATTPVPEIPIIDVPDEQLPSRHRVARTPR